MANNYHSIMLSLARLDGRMQALLDIGVTLATAKHTLPAPQQAIAQALIDQTAATVQGTEASRAYQANRLQFISNPPGMKMESLMQEYAAQAVQVMITYDGVYFYNRPAHIERLQRAVQEMLSNPGETDSADLMTPLGMVTTNNATLQGLMRQSALIQSAAESATADALQQNFSNWQDAANYYQNKLEDNYAAFLYTE